MHLHEYVGANGLAKLLSFLDIGQIDPDGMRGSRVHSTRELAEIIRRLMLPHYEEARLYWSAAEADGVFDGANESSPYIQGTLEGIIRDYGPKDDQAQSEEGM